MGAQARAKREKRQIKQAFNEVVDEASTRSRWSSQWMCGNPLCRTRDEASKAEWRVNPATGQVGLYCYKCGCRVLFPRSRTEG